MVPETPRSTLLHDSLSLSCAVILSEAKNPDEARSSEPTQTISATKNDGSAKRSHRREPHEVLRK